MKTIRKSVWETNSSSSHSLVIDKETYKNTQRTPKDLSKNKESIINKIKKKNRKINLYLGEYGWHYDILETFEEKLAYIVTSILCFGWDDKITQKKVQEQLQESGLLSFLQEHFGIEEVECSNIKDCYIDHQSYDMIPDTFRRNLYSEDMVNFLVDENIKILITNDNSPSIDCKKYFFIDDMTQFYEGKDEDKFSDQHTYFEDYEDEDFDY